MGYTISIETTEPKHHYVLTFINYMCIHICRTTYQYVCTYRQKAVPLQKKKKEKQTNN